MNSFAVIYQFLCPNCSYIGVGKHVFDANGPDEASHMLSTVTLPCTVCHRSVTNDIVAKTYVLANKDQGASDSSTSPAVPCT
jgi:hypothetical protein